MTKTVNPKAETFTLMAQAKTESEKKAVTYFKDVLRRDGLEMRKELLDLISNEWVRRHPPPGNPQTQLFQHGFHEESKVVCEVCGAPAVYRCKTVFSVNPTKNLCGRHTVQFERRGEVTDKKRIGDPS